MRLIDADPLKDKKEYCVERHENVVPVCVIDWQPTIDAVPVVRCKDCIMRGDNKEKGYKYCMFAGWLIKDDDFCSKGERMDEVQDETD